MFYRLLRAAQRVPGSQMRPSEPELRTTGQHELDRQSQPNQRGCHSRVVQDQPFTFCRLFGTASIFSKVFSMHSISFLLRETELEWLALNMPNRRGTTVCLSANPRQCMRQVSGNTLHQVETYKYLGVLVTCDGK